MLWFFVVVPCLCIIQNRTLTWKLNAFISVIVNVSINIKKCFEEKENPNLYTHFWDDQILNSHNSLSSIATLLSMYSKICLWKCTRYSDRLTETGDNFVKLIYICALYIPVYRNRICFMAPWCCYLHSAQVFSTFFLSRHQPLYFSKELWTPAKMFMLSWSIDPKKERNRQFHSCSRISLLKRYFTFRAVQPLKLKYSQH